MTGNVIENAPYAGIAAGLGPYLRDVAMTANVVRRAEFGIAVSVAPGAGAAVIADNMISEARARRHRRHGMEEAGDRRSQQGRRRSLRPIVDRGQPGTLNRSAIPFSSSPPRMSMQNHGHSLGSSIFYGA